MTFYEPLEVKIVSDEHSSWPEPALDSDAKFIDKLRWLAGCIKARTGITIKFSDGSTASGPGYRYEWPELIGVHVEGSSTSQHADAIWNYLNGVESGAWAAKHPAFYGTCIACEKEHCDCWDDDA